MLPMSGVATVPAGTVEVLGSEGAGDAAVDTITLKAIKVGAVTTR
jgi:hypothetical protein